MGMRPAKFQEKPGTIARTAGFVGRTPWSAADAPVGRLAHCKMLALLFRQRGEGVPGPEGPGGPPPQAPRWFVDLVPVATHFRPAFPKTAKHLTVDHFPRACIACTVRAACRATDSGSPGTGRVN